MAFCTNAELIGISGTTLDSGNLDAIRAQADREIKARIKAAGIVTPAASDGLTAASLNLSIAGILMFNRMNTELTRRTQTKSVKFGDVTITDDPDKTIAALTDKAWLSVDAYIQSQATEEAAEEAETKTWVLKVNK